MRVYLQPRFAALLYRSALATVSSAAAGFAAGALLGTVNRDGCVCASTAAARDWIAWR